MMILLMNEVKGFFYTIVINTAKEDIVYRICNK